MKCPHCTVSYHPDWNSGPINLKKSQQYDADADPYYDSRLRRETAWIWLATKCAGCNKTIIDIALFDVEDPEFPLVRNRAYPLLEPRMPVSAEVPVIQS